ncbi:hypothetical protein C7974DRAFT_226221 [Boeremia exigua]|uniref:uncharacterized protein n=1 Tax=Boeremia exigua TaxID=749465 RepID=UPI001E8CF46D|nr:uncharacterized protein C7974DRAFT_226221 [Boeremia exigua]KAH6620097.1 hypothetical protein C7974DRAFT_226221 [Boeremia exigua]
MATNTSSREHPLQHQALLSPVTGSMDQLPTEGSTAKSKQWQTTVTHVPSWPEEGRALRNHTWLNFFYGIGDIILVLLPVYFILLAVAAATLNGKPTKDNDFGRKVEFAMDLGPTMFPIIFAAISGRSMKMIARYLAEKGTKLSNLEMLMASQSVWGTVESQLLMQRITIVGANLLFLWALSPLGGQASLRLMQRGNHADITSTKLRYMTTGPAAGAYSITTSGLYDRRSAQAGSLYNAALMAPLSTKIGPQDLWGNMKIPSLTSLNLSTSDQDGWIDVSSKEFVPEDYASLVGVPIAGIPSNASTNFTVEYNYLTVSCNPFIQRPYPGLHGTNDPTSTNYSKLNEMVPGRIWRDKTIKSEQPFDPYLGRASFILDTPRDLARLAYYNDQKDAELYQARLDSYVGFYNQSSISVAERETPRQLTFASVYGIDIRGEAQGLSITNCSLFQRHVEASAVCTGSSCAVNKLRKSLTDTRPDALTMLESITLMLAMAQEFPTAIKFDEGSSPTEFFMMNTSAYPYALSTKKMWPNDIYANVSDLSPELFSQRFSLVLNTYYQVMLQPSGYFGSLTGNLSAYGPDTLPVTDVNTYLPANFSATEHTFESWITKFQTAVSGLDYPFLGATTTAAATTSMQIFVCNFAWMVLLLVSSSSILITGMVAVVLKRRTLGPEMFGFVSSMTYENPWLGIPKGGTMLDGMERARLLKDVEVCIGDVRGDDDVGHIALAAGVPLRSLERGRLYC